MKLTLATFFNASSILRSNAASSSSSPDKNPNVKVNVEQQKGSAPPPQPPRPAPPKVDVKINAPPKGGIPPMAYIAGILAVGGAGAYWWVTAILVCFIFLHSKEFFT